MKRDNKMKMRSLLMAIIMLASAMFIIGLSPQVKAAYGGSLKTPRAFTLQSPQSTDYGRRVTNGTWNISWTQAWMTDHAEDDTNYPTSYNVSIVKKKSDNTTTTHWNASANNGNATWFSWNTTKWADGEYYIYVYAHNATDDGAGPTTRYRRNATGHGIKIEVCNNMRSTPGIDMWRGCNYTMHGVGFNAQELTVISSVTVTGSGSAAAGSISLEAGDKVSITLDSGYAENMTSDLSSNRFYLCYPVYNGSEHDSTFNLRWKRATSANYIDPSGSIDDYTFGDASEGVDLYLTDNGLSSGTPVAGLWIIDDCEDWSNADASNSSQFNSTIPAWFWVNTSTDYTVNLDSTETEFAYNATGYVTFDVDDNSSADTAATIDIRRSANDTSIYNGNRYAGAGGHGALKYYKNNSLNKVQYGRGMYGFWSVGNYTARAYFDEDYYRSDATKGVEDRLRYTGYSNMQNTGNWTHYNATYGASSNKNDTDTWNAAASRYDWLYCGPWDPPEHNASIRTIRVTPGTPTVAIATANATMYFDFSGEVNISISEPNLVNLEKCNVSIFAQNGTNVTHQFVLLTTGHRADIDWGAVEERGLGVIDVSNVSKGYIRINHSSWGKNTSGHAGAEVTPFGSNGTWTVMIYADLAPEKLSGVAVSGDRNRCGIGNAAYTEEWNTSITFEVASSSGRLVFKMIDDDGNITGGTDSDGVIRRVPQDTRLAHITTQAPARIQFSVQNADHRYLGANDMEEAKKNITLSGDALFLDGGSVRLDSYPNQMVTYSGGTWTINMIPTMNVGGGTITIAVNWGTHGSHTETIKTGYDTDSSIINGTIVEISPTTFAFNENVSITVTVKHPADGGALTGGTVSLYWLKDDGGLGDKINTSGTPDTAGGNTYTFHFNTTQQDAWQINSSTLNGWSSVAAPRNITAYANVTNIGTGYARAKMDSVKDLKVTVYPSEFMAGQGQAKVHFNTTTVDSTGNKTGRPQNTGLVVRIYNSTGHDVTAQIGSLTTAELAGSANKNQTNEYIREPGVYTVHAYNATHKSWGSTNATLTVTAVAVTCDLGDFIWGVDKNISATFTATYKGQPINNTGITDYLRIDNISKQGSGATQYNKTWTNTSFGWNTVGGAGQDNIGATSGASNTSIEVSRYSGGFINGVVTINDITANTLDERIDSPTGLVQPSERLIHFFYKPGTTNSIYANCTGVVKVKLPDVTASPASVPWNKPAELEITVTGRGTPLEDVRVNITVPGLTALTGSDTNSEGKVIFAFTPPATGNVRILIENRTSATVVPVTAWALYLDAPSQTNEGESFTVTVRNGTATGTAVAGATVTFNKKTYTSGTDGTVTIPDADVPTVTVNRDYTISATKTGHAEDSDTITVLNVPKLSVVAPSTVTASSTFDVVIADDAGNSVVGATITLDGTTYTSGANGIATLTAPSTEGTITITASKTGFETSDAVTVTVEKEGGIPGFELLTLIIAIGVAFILLRRRRH